MPQHIQRPAPVERIAQSIQQSFARLIAVVLDDRIPRLGLRGLHPRQHIVGKLGPCLIISDGIGIRVLPAVGGEVFADFVLEIDLFVQTHSFAIKWDFDRACDKIGCGAP